MLSIPTIFQAATSADTEKIEIEQLLGASDTTDAFDAETVINGKPQPRVFNVKDYLPTWLVDEHDNGNTLFVKFMQYYYDWLYNPEESNIYNNRVFDFIDIEKIVDPIITTRDGSVLPPTKILTTALNSHVPGLAAIFESYEYKPHLENVKSLIKNIKRDIYQRKGTPNSASILFGTLFPEVESVTIGAGQGVGSTDYSTNLGPLASTILREKACITVFGDSINSPGTFGFMRHGYIREWRPAYWRGISPHISGGNKHDNGFWIKSTNSQGAVHYTSTNNPSPDHSENSEFEPPGNYGGAELMRNFPDSVSGYVSSANSFALVKLTGTPPTANFDNNRRIFVVEANDTVPAINPFCSDNCEHEDCDGTQPTNLGGGPECDRSNLEEINGNPAFDPDDVDGIGPDDESNFKFLVGTEQNNDAGGDGDDIPFRQSTNLKMKTLIINAGDADTFIDIRARQTGSVPSHPSQPTIPIDAAVDGVGVPTLVETDISWGVQPSLARVGHEARLLQASFYFGVGSQTNDTIHINKIYICDETIPGLALDYLGSGGWRTKNHSAPTVDDAPFLDIAGTSSSGRGWYSNESLQQSLKMLDTNIAMIWIGQNDDNAQGIDPNDPDSRSFYENNIEDLILRIRTAADAIDLTHPKILLISTYITSNDDGNRATKDFMADIHKQFALNDPDVSHINLHHKIIVEHGQYDEWSDDLLADEVSPTHPSLRGAKVFAAHMWQIIRDAEANEESEDSNPNDLHINLKDNVILTGSDGVELSSENTTDMITDIFREFIEPAGLKLPLIISAVSTLDEETEDQSDEDFNAS
mgnify:CR=1 FL=1